MTYSVPGIMAFRSEEHTSELQSLRHLVCRLLLEKKRTNFIRSEEQTSELQSLRHLVRSLFNETAPTEISTLSLHDALPISSRRSTFFFLKKPPPPNFSPFPPPSPLLI